MATKKSTAQAAEVIPTVEKSVEKVKNFSADDVIVCRSVTAGELIAPGKSGAVYRAPDYGSELFIRYDDLLVWKQSHSDYIYKVCFVIEDEELLANKMWADVKKMYDGMFLEADINAFFRMDAKKMEEVLKKSPKNFTDSVKAIAATRIENGELDSVSKIKVLDKLLGTDFMDTM